MDRGSTPVLAPRGGGTGRPSTLLGFCSANSMSLMMGCGPAAATAGLEALLPLTAGAPATPDGRGRRGPMAARRRLGVSLLPSTHATN